MTNGVSVLLPVFNGEEYIEAQIRSIFSQTHPSISLFVRDNCSSDRTVQILERLCAEYSPKIHLIRSSSNTGLLGSVSSLMEVVAKSGSVPYYMMFSDGDDIWLPDKITVTLQKMKELESLFGENIPLLVHTDLKVVDRDLNQLSPSFWKYSNISPRNSCLAKLLTQNCVTGCTVLINRPLFELAQPIPSCTVMHDWWMALVAAAFGQIGYLAKPTMLYRQHGKNVIGAQKYGILTCLKKKPSKSGLKSKMIGQARAFLDRYKMVLSEEQIELIRSFIQFKQRPFPICAYHMIRNGFFKHGILGNVKGLLGL